MRIIALAALAALSSAPSAVSAQDYDHGHHDDRGYGDRRDDRGYDHRYDRTYRGRDGRYYSPCRRSSGTTGLIAGGVGGGLIANALGGGTLGTIAGAGGGALLGRHLDRRHDEAQNRRNGC